MDGSSFEPVCVARGGAQLTDGAQSSAAESERVVGEDSFGSSVVILVLDLVDEGADVDTDGACFLARTVRALHAPRRLGHGFLFRVEPVMERPRPVIPQIFSGYSFEFYFMFMSILFPGFRIDDLRVVQLWSRGKDVLYNLGGVFCQTEAVDGGTDESSQHEMI